jgi:DNA-binding CsgD family transcriptional regulator
VLRTDDAELIGGIYGTVEADEGWNPLLDQFCTRLGVRSAVAQILHEQPGRLEVVWNARDSLSRSRAEVHDRWANSDANPRLALRPEARERDGEIGSDNRLYGDDLKALEHLRVGLAKIGLGQGFWAGFEISPGRHFSVIMHRAAGDDRDLGSTDQELLATLLPHFKRSLRLGSSKRIDEQRTTALQAALDLITVPTLLCDRGLDVQWANAAALDLLGNSEILRMLGGTLEAITARDAKRLRQLVAEVAEGRSPGSIENFVSQSGRSHQIRITPAPSSGGDSERKVIVCLSNQSPGVQFDASEIMKIYGLTPAESRLAAAIAQGVSVSDYASGRGLAVGTARVQLKQVLAKTGMNRQAELVRELGESILARTRSPIN